MLPIGSSSNGTELIIGLIYAVGTNSKSVSDAVKESLAKVTYLTEEIHIIEKLGEFDQWRNVQELLREGRYGDLMTVGNQFRSKMKCNDALAMLTVAHIRNTRSLRSGSQNTPNPRTAYIIRSLKNPEEVQALRSIYGRNFIAIGIYSTEADRIEKLSGDMAYLGGSGRTNQIDADAVTLVQRDREEADEDFGQNVRAAYPLADFFVNAADPLLETEVKRTIELFFERSKHTATKEEYGMFHAFCASLRSSSLARQVGAAICSSDGQVIALGCNDVPKNKGGLHWEKDTPDFRDHIVGHDTNDRMRAHLVRDVLKRLKDNKWLNEELMSATEQELLQKALENNDAPLRNAMLMDIIEYGRAVHAEMDAITDAARRGVSLQDSVLYTTTFPCHNCAKHILAAGIAKVVYIEPYHKSYTLDFYKGCIIADSSQPHTVGMEIKSFVGIAPRQYIRLYSMGSSPRKDDKGDVLIWNPITSSLREPESESTYLPREAECIAALQSMLLQTSIVSDLPETIR